MLHSPEIIPLPRRTATGTPAEPTVLVIAAVTDAAEQFAADVVACGFTPQTADSLHAASSLLQATPCEVCLVGELGDGECLSSLTAEISRRGAATQVIQVIDSCPVDEPRLLPHSPGVELLPRPYSLSQLGTVLYYATERARLLAENRRLKRQLSNHLLRMLVGHSPAMHALRRQVQEAADAETPVLVVGEPGTGVDAVALAIHESSRRAHRHFIKINCRVHSAESLEQELFGAESAPSSHRPPTRLDWANGGTLFLDAFEAIALPLQRRLYQVFSEQQFKADSGQTVRFDTRIIAGSEADLTSLLAAGLVRQDLYEFVQSGTISLPPLRDHLEDLAPLTESFLQQIADREGRPPRSLALDALTLLRRHPWPGNVRELESLLERACAIDCGTRITAAALEPWLAETVDPDAPCGGLTLSQMERKLIEATFVRFAGNRERTAKALDIGIRTLSGKLREYGYPPRGGPGSNQPNQPALRIHDDHAERRAA